MFTVLSAIVSIALDEGPISVSDTSADTNRIVAAEDDDDETEAWPWVFGELNRSWTAPDGGEARSLDGSRDRRSQDLGSPYETPLYGLTPVASECIKRGCYRAKVLQFFFIITYSCTERPQAFFSQFVKFLTPSELDDVASSEQFYYIEKSKIKCVSFFYIYYTSRHILKKYLIRCCQTIERDFSEVRL